MFGFGNNDDKKPAAPARPPVRPMPPTNPYERTSKKPSTASDSKAHDIAYKTAGSFGVSDLDYVLAHFAPETMKQVDSIEQTVKEIKKNMPAAEAALLWEGKYHELEYQYDVLKNRHNGLLQYLADKTKGCTSEETKPYR